MSDNVGRDFFNSRYIGWLHLTASIVTLIGFLSIIWAFASNNTVVSFLGELNLAARTLVYIFIECSFSIAFALAISKTYLGYWNNSSSKGIWFATFIFVCCFSSWQTASLVGMFFQPSTGLDWAFKSVLPFALSGIILGDHFDQELKKSRVNKSEEAPSSEGRGYGLFITYASTFSLMTYLVSFDWK